MLDYLSPVKEVELKAKGGIYVVSMSFSTANISRSRSKTKKRVEGGGGGGRNTSAKDARFLGGGCGCMFPQKFWKLSVSKMAISSKKGNLHLNNFLLYL